MQKKHYVVGAIEILAFALLLLLIVMFARFYAELPDAAGEQGALRTDHTYFAIVFWLGVITYSVLFVLKRFPRLISFPVRITPENVDFQARAAKTMLSITTLFSMCVFDIALFDLYRGALSRQAPMHTLPIAVCFVCILVNIIVYFIVARARK